MAPILPMVEKFNALVKNAIGGPNCIDRNICDGNCCFIRIDIPKVLASYYIDKGFAQTTDFERGEVFAFRITVDMQKLRCTFFSKEINGCSLHLTGMKPPQCWVYPTGLDPASVKTDCKKAEGWHIADEEAVVTANKILEEYVKECKEEALQDNSPTAIAFRLSGSLEDELKTLSPKEMAGVKDGWDRITPLVGEGYNMGCRSFCNDCQYGKNYFECDRFCPETIKDLVNFLKETLPMYIQKQGFHPDYLLFDLKQSNACD